ncbi:MAG: hypothetical protein EOO88_54605, partial [Pedobacter sp.]
MKSALWSRVVLSLLLLHSGSVFACHCSNYDPLNEITYKKYKYIAFVKVKAFAPFTAPADNRKDHQYSSLAMFTVDVLENYKTPLPDTLLMDGYKTSCDIGLRPGQEWVIFMNDLQDYATVFSCNYSFRYRDQDGKRDLADNSGDAAINRLRKAFNVKSDIVRNGRVESFYPTGQKETSAYYKLGQFDGERLYWYPNGQLWGRETYVNGLKDGVAEKWFADGHVAHKEKYSRGILVDTSQSWYESKTYLPTLRMLSDMYQQSLDSTQRLYGGHQLLNTTLYDQHGHQLYAKSYYRTGRIMVESVSLPDKGIDYVTRFRENGLIQMTNLSERVEFQLHGSTRQTLLEIDYNEDGTYAGYAGYCMDIDEIIEGRK